MTIKVPQGRTIVALSGGADSVALLRLLLDAGKPVSELVALHCNFHLRGEESDRDERFVCSLCSRLGVALHVRHFQTQDYAREQGISVEMAARELRYEWFGQMRQSLHCHFIAVAHHRDDQAETVLLNLLRGTGLRGLAGMRECNGHIVRPLLAYGKQEILDYLESIGQDYVTDSTNLERDALRNRIRLDVLPLLKDINPKAVEHIVHTASIVASSLEAGLADVSTGTYTLHSLHEWLHPYGFTSAQERDILRNIDGPSGAVYESPTHRLLRDRQGLVLSAKNDDAGECALSYQLVETGDAKAFLRTQPLDDLHAYLDADKLTLPLQMRHPQQGDRFCPFGMKGSRLISDFLTDLKLNRFEKERQWLLVSGNDIVWVVGHRSDNRYRVTEDTRRIYCISLNKS